MDIRRNIILIVSIMFLGASWFMLPDGRLRNAFLLILSALIFIILLTPGLPGGPGGPNGPGSASGDGTVLGEDGAGGLGWTVGRGGSGGRSPGKDGTARKLRPSENLEECLQYHRIANHPASVELLARIDDYRRLVLNVAKERAGRGSLWRGVPDDTRISGCLCGSLTRDEVIKALQIQEDDAQGEIGFLLEGGGYWGNVVPPAEDGHPSNRILHDVVTDRLFNILIDHRPEAREHLRMAQTRYHENILRRLVGPLDGKGRAIFPLCRWRKRYDGQHFSHFEILEGMFSGGGYHPQ
jgi:hypothetical protein